MRVGIDFGTSNSALAIEKDGVTHIVDISNEVFEEIRQSTLKSVLFIDEDWNIFTGQNALLQYLHERQFGRFMRSLKAFLPVSSFDKVRLYGESVTLEELVSFILKEIKKLGEEYLKETITEVVLGRPVLFSENPVDDQFAENRLRMAAELAGFKKVSFQHEPIAATLAYYSQAPSSKKDRIVLMGDFGGGTSDFTVMSLPAGQSTGKTRESEVLAIGGACIGGDTFDSRIMWEKITPYFGRDVTYETMSGQTLSVPMYIMRNLCRWHMISFMREPKTLQSIRDVRRTASATEPIDRLEHLILENKGILIFQAIEKAKRELSSQESTIIRYKDDDLDIEEPITRDEFEEFINEDLNQISSAIKETMKNAGVPFERIDAVLLTGGTSFIPAVRSIFESLFGTEKIVNLDAFTSVARGLTQSN